MKDIYWFAVLLISIVLMFISVLISVDHITLHIIHEYAYTEQPSRTLPQSPYYAPYQVPHQRPNQQPYQRLPWEHDCSPPYLTE